MQFPWVSRKKYNEVVGKLERLLCQATGNLLSKSTYPIEVMEEQAMDYVQRRCDEAVEDYLSEQNELGHCDFCCYLDFEDSNGAMKSYPKEDYIFYAGYSKQFDVDIIDEFETENIKYCPMCGRQLRGIDNAS